MVPLRGPRRQVKTPPHCIMSERIYFGKLKEAAEPPNLIEVQLNSYVEVLLKDVSAS